MAKRFTNDELDRILEEFEELVLDKATNYLILDKQVTSRKGLVNALKGAGVETDYILEASDGLDALGIANSNGNRFVVIFDISNADTDAPAFIEKLRQKEGHAKDAIVLYTAENNKAKLAAAMKAGVSDYIRKPAQPAEVIDKLKKLELL